MHIEDYALIGDTRTAALVGRNGSIDWLCWPDFDSPACFAALLGDDSNGRWQIRPSDETARVERTYRGETLILETTFTTADGQVRLIDAMTPELGGRSHLVRLIEGVSGTVAMQMELVLRTDYGQVVPWVWQEEGALRAVAGPDSYRLTSSITTRGVDKRTVANFDVSTGEQIPFVLEWSPSHEKFGLPLDGPSLVDACEATWEEWSSRCTFTGSVRAATIRSLITLKALTYAPTGGIVAAPTTSLPEDLGGVRNWDYRYCWLRDATFTLYALMLGGYIDEAEAWRDWLVRAVAGEPSCVQIMYGLRGERRLPETEADWLAGYEGSAPVRLGNAAAGQFQLDTYGEVMDALHVARGQGMEVEPRAWEVQRALVEFVSEAWDRPDEGIWEVRGPRRHFTHSKVMAWVALDRAVKATERFGLAGPADEWRRTRAEIHADVCAKGYNTDVGAFTQSYGSTALDASVLMIPLVGFLPATDRRVVNTVEAIERDLTVDGFVLRYATDDGSDGLPGDEGAFLACSFWLVDNLALIGRRDEAQALFERLCALANDVGLLAEEYDPRYGRQVGNFPQAFTHISLVNSAWNLSDLDDDASVVADSPLSELRNP